MITNDETQAALAKEVHKTFSEHLAENEPFKNILQEQGEVNASQAELLGKILADFDKNSIIPLLQQMKTVLSVPHYEVLLEQLKQAGQQINYQTLSYAGFGVALLNTTDIVSYKMSEDYRSIQKELRGIYEDEKGKYHLDSIKFARFIKMKFPLVTTTDGTFYMLEESVYKKYTKLKVSALVSKEIKKYIPGLWNQSRQNDYLEAIKQETLIDETEKEDYQKKYLNFPNGYLDLDTLYFHTEGQAELFFTGQQSYLYDPEASCPQFLESLESIFCEDKQLIEVFQQLFGYLLTHEQKIQKGFFFLGSGSNGKSLLIKLMTAVIGPEFITNTSLKSLSSRFGYSDLIGKKVMFSTENEMTNYKDTEHFKAVTGGDRITVEQKNKHAVTMKITAKIAVASNKMIDSMDTSEGFLRRVYILPFSQHYLSPVPIDEQDPTKKYMDVELEDKLMNELPGILNFALEGLQQLRNNQYVLPVCRASEEAAEQYRIQQTPIKSFFDKAFVKESTATYERSNLFEEYNDWREAENYNPKAYSRAEVQREFENHLRSIGLLSKAQKIQGYFYYKGIREK